MFISDRWAKANPSITRELAADPLFEIVNHGTTHVPLSVTGRSAWKIKGTASAAAAAREVWGNTLGLEEVLGHRPTLFRCGTAMYDDVAVAIARSLGELPVGFTKATDFGASASAKVVARQLRTLPPGGIGLGHFNHPEKATAEGVISALPRMLDAGWAFLTVSQAR